MEGVAAGVINPLAIHCETVRLKSEHPTQFIDLTAWVERAVRRSGVRSGLVQIQVMHTTAAIIVNENEPLLLGDFEALLERLVPANGFFAHDDMSRRGPEVDAEERRNGWGHARALLLGASKVLGIEEGFVALGRWQSILLVELDGPRERSVSIVVMGHGEDVACGSR